MVRPDRSTQETLPFDAAANRQKRASELVDFILTVPGAADALHADDVEWLRRSALPASIEHFLDRRIAERLSWRGFMRGCGHANPKTEGDPDPRVSNVPISIRCRQKGISLWASAMVSERYLALLKLDPEADCCVAANHAIEFGTMNDRINRSDA